MVTNGHFCSISRIVTGVCQLVNKMEENTGKIKPFNQNDEQFLEAFVIFCGLGIQNTQMYEAVERAMAKQMVTLEVGRSWRKGFGVLSHTLGFSFPSQLAQCVCVLWLCIPTENTGFSQWYLCTYLKAKESRLQVFDSCQGSDDQTKTLAHPLLFLHKAVLAFCTSFTQMPTVSKSVPSLFISLGLSVRIPSKNAF